MTILLVLIVPALVTIFIVFMLGTLNGLERGRKISDRHMRKAMRRRWDEYAARRQMGIDELEFQLAKSEITHKRVMEEVVPYVDIASHIPENEI